MYTCSKCGTKFPTVVSRQHYLIVADEQLRTIKEGLESVKRDNQELKSRMETMAREQDELQTSLIKSRRDGEIKELETKMNELELYVSYLRKEKGELEQKASRLG